MATVWLSTLASVVLVSLVSFAGLFVISFGMEKWRNAMFVIISFAAGTLLGDIFFHLLPEVVEESRFPLSVSVWILFGISFLFILEKIVRWRHCHLPESSDHPHPFAIMNLVGDAAHNFIDGIVIAASYMVSIPTGIATTLAVIFHEIPQEIGDFSVLIHGGFSKSRALFFNFLSALTAVLGAIVALSLARVTDEVNAVFIPFTIGSFLYIAGADLIPELHKEVAVKKSFAQFIAFVFGAAVMAALLLLE
jgi:zinc and cadmium transporter